MDFYLANLLPLFKLEFTLAIYLKAFVSFEGVKTVSKGRRKLLNRLIFSTCSKNPWIEYVDWLYQIYDADKLKNIYLLSDGGLWIKLGIDELKMNPGQVVKRLLCEFHFKQAIHRMSSDKDIRQLLLIFLILCLKKVLLIYLVLLLLLLLQSKIILFNYL